MAALRRPEPATLLTAWEQGLNAGPVLRPLALLAAAWPGAGIDGLAALPMGRRDAALLDLRELLFGPDLGAVADCPECGVVVELAFRSGDIRADGAAVSAEGEWSARWEDYDLRFGLPNTLDVAWLAAGNAGNGDAERSLLGRCLVKAERKGEPVSLDDLPPEAVAAAAATMAKVDPQADVRLSLACPACGREWSAAFDIAGYLWAEVETWAQRTLIEIHALASAYGWREADILALSPARRQMYIELAQA